MLFVGDRLTYINKGNGRKEFNYVPCRFQGDSVELSSSSKSTVVDCTGISEGLPFVCVLHWKAKCSRCASVVESILQIWWIDRCSSSLFSCRCFQLVLSSSSYIAFQSTQYLCSCYCSIWVCLIRPSAGVDRSDSSRAILCQSFSSTMLCLQLHYASLCRQLQFWDSVSLTSLSILFSNFSC